MESLLIEIDWIVVGFMMLFFLALAFFYTLFITALFKIEIKPSWLFFVLFPTLLLTVAFIDKKYVFLTFIGLFAFLVLVAVLGGLYSATKDFISSYKKRRKKESRFKILVSVLLSIIVIIAFFALPLPLSFILIITFAILQGILKMSTKDVFLRLQTSLPTSKIRSIAMGLVEVHGTTQLIEPLISRLKKKECIGYKYTIEKEKKDKDGKISYTEIFSETICNPFLLNDKTGTITVTGEDIAFEWFPVDERYRHRGKRYTQYLLLPEQEMLLIGKASSKNNVNFIERETIKDVFTIAPFTKVSRWNRLKPIRTSFYSYLIVLFALIAIILMTDFIVEDNIIHLHFKINIDINQFFK